MARPLPAEVVAGLRTAFAEDVAERLPRLRAAALGPELLRDVHALGSSAYVVGEPAVALVARAVEALLDQARQGEPGLDDDVRRELTELVARLEGWAP